MNVVDKIVKDSVSLDTIDSPIITSSEASLIVGNWTSTKWQSIWTTPPLCTYQKTFCLRSNSNSLCQLRSSDSIISRLRLMQSKLKAGLFKIGLVDDPNCDLCGVPQDNVHFLLSCPSTDDLRTSIKDEITRRNLNIAWNFQSLLSNPFIAEVVATYVRSRRLTV